MIIIIIIKKVLSISITITWNSFSNQSIQIVQHQSLSITMIYQRIGNKFNCFGIELIESKWKKSDILGKYGIIYESIHFHHLNLNSKHFNSIPTFIVQPKSIPIEIISNWIWIQIDWFWIELMESNGSKGKKSHFSSLIPWFLFQKGNFNSNLNYYNLNTYPKYLFMHLFLFQ